MKPNAVKPSNEKDNVLNGKQNLANSLFKVV